MYALQSGVNRFYEDKEDNLIIHYHGYDRDYKNSGHLDEYNSESLTIKGERKINSNENLSFGFGSEYKYDWGKFENRGSYKQSMKGHIADLGLFANAGYKLSDDTILSLYGRFDDHKTTGFNETYKVNLTKIIKNFKIGASHSTGLRNPSLYELYGSADYNYKGNRNLDAEKSTTNEIFASYELQDNLTVSSTVYRATIFDRIEQTNNYRSYENKKLDLNQEGLESELIFNRKNQKISLFTNFSKSKTTGGDAQLRRPDITYGANYYQKFNSSIIGIFDMNLNYKFTGKHWDISSSNVEVKSTNIVNLLASKNLNNTIFKVSISNLLNERYERPITYSQDGRQLRLGFSRNF